MTRPLLFTALLVLAACTEAPQHGTSRVTGPSACGAEDRQSLVGLSHQELLKTEILGPVRIIRPDQAVTMEFIAARLNIALDETDTVIRVTCG